MKTIENPKDQKKTWTMPKLTVYGDVEKITKESPLAPLGHS